MRIFHISLFIIGIVVFAGCSTDNASVEPSSQKDNPIAVEIVSAYNYLLELHRQNRIPGDSKDLHGTVRPIDLVLTNPPPYAVTYPFSWTFYVVRNGHESFTNSYIVGRESATSAWQLQRAWSTDTNGQVVKEWPVK